MKQVHRYRIAKALASHLTTRRRRRPTRATTNQRNQLHPPCHLISPVLVPKLPWWLPSLNSYVFFRSNNIIFHHFHSKLTPFSLSFQSQDNDTPAPSTSLTPAPKRKPPGAPGTQAPAPQSAQATSTPQTTQPTAPVVAAAPARGSSGPPVIDYDKVKELADVPREQREATFQPGQNRPFVRMFFFFFCSLNMFCFVC